MLFTRTENKHDFLKFEMNIYYTGQMSLTTLSKGVILIIGFAFS